MATTKSATPATISECLNMDFDSAKWAALTWRQSEFLSCAERGASEKRFTASSASASIRLGSLRRLAGQHHSGDKKGQHADHHAVDGSGPPMLLLTSTATMPAAAITKLGSHRYE